MTTEMLDTDVFQPGVGIKTGGIFNLTRGLTPYESEFLRTNTKSKLKRTFLIRNSRLVDSAIKDSKNPENILNILSYISYVGQTFISLDAKGSSTPEQVTSAINGLEELFSLPVFNHATKPIQIAFGSAIFRISDKEFYRATCRDGKMKVQSGMLVPVWNPAVTLGGEIN